MTDDRMPGIVHIRIDDRLLHGQVCAFWTNTLKLTRIMVANDEVAEDELQKQVLRMAAPTGIRTSIISLKKAATQILEKKYAGQRVLMIIKNPGDALKLIEMGLPIQHINVGNMANRPNTVQYKKSISLTKEEYDQIMKLHEMGVEMDAQMTPDEHYSDLMSFLNK